MIRTVEAVIDEQGNVRLLEPILTGTVLRALVTILDQPSFEASATALISESALAQDWDRPEEEDAWSHLQPVR